MSQPSSRWLCLTVVGLGLGAPIGAAQERAAFVMRLGNDTVAAEQFVRSDDRIEGREVSRTPRVTVTDYVARLAPDGAIARLELRVQRPGESRPEMSGTIDFESDSAHAAVTRAGESRSGRVSAPRGSIPWVSFSLGLYEPLLRRFIKSEVDSVAVSLVTPTTWSLPVVIHRVGRGRYEVRYSSGTFQVQADDEGRIKAWDGTASTVKILAERLPAVDLAGLTASFISRERAGRTMGALSPRDSSQATFGGATVVVSYGRPARRGRRIFGDVVPWNRVWRTGANAATELRTDRDLIIGGTQVPAGEYTLWTIPSPTGWTLIVNKQTGQWGTEYDARQDLARVALRSEPVAQVLEWFTLSIEPGENGGTAILELRWDEVRAWVPVRVG